VLIHGLNRVDSAVRYSVVRSWSLYSHYVNTQVVTTKTHTAGFPLQRRPIAAAAANVFANRPCTYTYRHVYRLRSST